jgi:hypothetical protein
MSTITYKEAMTSHKSENFKRKKIKIKIMRD